MFVIRRRDGDDPACRPRRVLRVGRATRRSAPAGPAGDRGRRGRARRELRGQGVRDPHGDGRPRRRAACARGRSSSQPRMSGVLRGEQGGVRGVRRHDAAGRGAVDRRGVPRRRRAATGRRARRSRSRRGCGARCSSRSVCRSRSGVARTKFLAKVASGVAKPDGLLVVPPDRELEFLHPLPVERLWGVGAVTAREAARAGHHDGRRRRPARRVGARRDARPRRRVATSTRWRTTAIRGRCRSGGAGGSIGSQHALGRRALEVARGDRRRRSSRSSTASPGGCAPRARVGRTVVLRLRFDDFSRGDALAHARPPDRAHRDDPRDRAAAARRRDADDRARRASRSSASRSPTSTTTTSSSSRCRSTGGAAARSTPRSTTSATGSDRRRSTRAVLLGRDHGRVGADAPRLSVLRAAVCVESRRSGERARR